MFTGKQDLLQYAKENKIPYHEDYTNKDPSILRNKIRTQLLPLLQSDYNPSISAHFSNIASILSEWNHYLQDEYEKIRHKDLNLISQNKIEVGMSFFDLYFSWIKIYTIEKILTTISNQPFKVSYRQYSDFSFWVETGRTGSRFQWEQTIYSVKRKNHIEFCQVPATARDCSITILKADKSYQIPNSDIQMSIKRISTEAVQFTTDPLKEYITGDNLKFPLLARPWQAGDRFKPLGLNKTKLVSDYLTDCRIGWPDRENIWVLLNGETIIAIIGKQISDDVKITDNSKRFTVWRSTLLEMKRQKLKIDGQEFVELFSSQKIQAKISQLAKEISRDYKNKTPIFVGVLNGAIIFLSDLIRHLDIECEIDFIKISSYGNKRISSGQITMIKDFSADLNSRDVIVVEDIVDSGLSVNYLKKRIETMKPASIKFVSLLVKRDNVIKPYKIDYVGFEIENKFVIGYGLDIAQKYRNLNSIYQVVE